jgi:Family of unknown function (DUF6011)
MSGERLVKVLIGPDPQAFESWATFGLVKAGQVQLWTRWDTRTYRAYARLLERPDYYGKRGYVYRTAVRCRRCNSPLTDKKSIERGLGGICQAYVQDWGLGGPGGSTPPSGMTPL